MNSHFDSNGVQIAYRHEGKGTPVVLIHGILDSAEIAWGQTGVFDALAAEHLVLALDIRGHGASGVPLQRGSYGCEMAKDVLRLLDHEGLSSASMCGYSFGAMILGKVIELAPNRVGRAVFGGGGPVRPHDPVLNSLSELAGELQQRGTLGVLLRVANRIGAPVPSDEEIAQMSSEIMVGNDPDAIALVAAEADGLACEAIPRIPTMAIWGSLDPIGVYAERIAGAKQVRIEGEDHLTTPFHPAFKEAIVGMLRG